MNGTAFCPDCGAPTPPQARFCRQCGAALKPGPAPPRLNVPEPPLHGSARWKAIALIAGGLIAVVTVVALAFAPEGVARAGESCGVLEQDILVTDTTLTAEVGIGERSARCGELLDMMRQYLTADDLCSDGGNSCSLAVEGWSCALPTAGSFPLIIRCEDGTSGTVAVGLDPAATATSSQQSCGTVPDGEPPGPFDVSTNLDCETAQLLADRLIYPPCSGQRCADLGFVCQTRNSGYESTTYDCRFEDARIEFEAGS